MVYLSVGKRTIERLRERADHANSQSVKHRCIDMKRKTLDNYTNLIPKHMRSVSIVFDKRVEFRGLFYRWCKAQYLNISWG